MANTYMRFGGRVRVADDSNFSNSAFNGVFTFPSLAAYNVTESGLSMGLTPAQSRAACLAASTNPLNAQCGASQLSLVTGQPQITNTATDVAFRGGRVAGAQEHHRELRAAF